MLLNRKKDPEFDELSYLYLNPDVEAAVLRGHFASGYEHWLQHGRAERRLRSVPGDFPAGWNEGRYLRLNPDVAAGVRAGVSPSGHDHWRAAGSYEARPGAAHAYERPSLKDVLQRAPEGFNTFGFHRSTIGLGAAIRGYGSALRHVLPVKEYPVSWNLEGSVWPPEQRPEFAINLIELNPDALPTFLNRYGPGVLPHRLNVGIWSWEMHAGYAAWHSLSRVFREIWAISGYSAEGIRTVSAVPVEVIPLVVEPPATGPHGLAAFTARSAFSFLYVFDVASSLERKNPLALLRAFQNAFGARPDVLLILKFQHAERDPAGVRALQRLAAAMPNVMLIPETVPEDALYGLLRSCDCFVSPHRAEGFGLNIAAAMFYRKPVIATGYSGNLEYMTPCNSFLIDYDLIAAESDQGAYKVNYAWADPSEEHLSKLLRFVLEHPEESARRGARAGETIRTNFSSESIAAKIRLRLNAWKSD